MKLKEKRLSSSLKFKGRIVNVVHDEVLLPDGQRSLREVITHPGGVCVAAMDEDGNFILVEQYRYAFQQIMLEFPAGKLEPNEDPLSAAVRELEEETGYRAKDLISLGLMYPSVGYLTEIIHLYFAPNPEFTQQKLDPHEFLNVKRFPYSVLVELSQSGQLNDAKTLALLQRLRTHLD
jgi:ADP-ribose pyrophosphatase